MKFAEPIWLFAGLLVILSIFWLYRRFDLRQRAALAEFASSHLLAKLTASFSPGRRLVKRALFVAALAFSFLALARPQLGYHWEEEKQRGIDILFTIDTSKSMLTQDVTPDRLTRAKLAITDFVGKLEGDRVGLIAFAGDAFLQAPLTLDYDAFQESLDAIDTGTIPRGGTDIASAINEAQVAFGSETKNRKILVLVTDGEDLELKGVDAARAAAKDGLVIYTVGVGSPNGGLIPITNANGGTDFVKDASGQFVKSHLDESTLRQIAEATGGLYEPLGQQGEGLQKIYDQALASLPKQELTSKRQRVYDERFQWPLAVGLGCLLASMLIGTRRRDPKPVLRAKAANKLAPVAAALALMAMVTGAQASPQSAENAYKKGDYATAEKQYAQAAEQQPETPPLQFNLGASAYKSGEYDKALPAFQKALSTDDVPVQQQAYYDMGNTQYLLGQKTEQSSPQDTIKAWQSAIQSYDAALKLKADDADAKFNRDFVQKKLDQLQKQNPPKQDQQKQNQQKQDQKQDDKNQQQQSNSQQDQQQNNQPNQDQKNQSQSGSGQDQKNQQQSGSGQDQKDQQANQNKPDQSKGDQAKNDQQQSQQNQAQNGQQNQQNQNGQQGQPKDQQSGQQETAGNQEQKPSGNDQQQKESSGQNQQLAQNDAKPAGPRGETIPDKDQSKQQQPAEAEAATGKPDELTPQEAKALLNSLKNGEHVLPAVADARNGSNHSPDEPPIKDW
jgi:Ca-activated chloride channel family protein